MRIGVLGINHKLADLSLREKLAIACQKRFSADRSICNPAVVLLSTCNRTEIYFCCDDLPDAHTHLLKTLRREVEEDDFDQKLYSYFGYDCFLHLARVAAGLDSANRRETEIQGQVKMAYLQTLECCQLPKELHYLFQKALKLGKEIRHQYPAERGIPDLGHTLFHVGKELFPCVETVKILFVGASKINRRILSYLQKKPFHSLTICNRTFEKGQELAKNLGATCLPWEALSLWHTFDWILFGTKSPRFLLTQKDLLNAPLSKKLIVDLSVPRNVDPQIVNHPLISLFNIDDMNDTLMSQRKSNNDSHLLAEGYLQKAAAKQIAIFHQKSMSKLKVVCTA